MNHIFYQTKTQYTNTGDALINQALINVLREYGELHTNCSKDIPEDFLDSLGIRPGERVNSSSEFEFIREVLSCSASSRKTGDLVYIFSGPGDLYGGGMRLVIRNLVASLVFPVFRLLGVRIIRIGRSVGPISKMMALSERFRGVFLSRYYVRDTQSLERCRKMGIKKTEFCPDLSWIYDCDHPTKINKTNTVMVNLRNSIFDDVDMSFVEATLQRCEEVLNLLHQSCGDNMKVCVAYQIDEDEAFSKIVYERLRSAYEVEYIGHQMRLEELGRYYGNVDYHISNRMHSLLAGYKYGSLPIALIDTEKHVKIAATFSDCSLNELMVDIFEPIDVQKVASLVAQREVLLHKLYACEEKNRLEIIKVLDLVFSRK